MIFNDKYGAYTLENHDEGKETWIIRVVNNEPVFKYDGYGIGVLVKFVSARTKEVFYIKPENVFASISIGQVYE